MYLEITLWNTEQELLKDKDHKFFSPCCPRTYGFLARVLATKILCWVLTIDMVLSIYVLLIEAPLLHDQNNNRAPAF